MDAFILVILQFSQTRSKFTGFGSAIVPAFSHSPKLIVDVSYATFPESGFFGIQGGAWLYGGSIMPSEVSSADSITLNLSGITFYAGPVIGRPVFYISPTVGLGLLKANPGASPGGMVGLKVSMFTRHSIALIDFFAGYTIAYGKRYDGSLQYVKDTSFVSPVVSIALNPFFFTPTSPLREWSDEELEKYYHGTDLPVFEESSDFSVSVNLDRYLPASSYDLSFEFAYARYSRYYRIGNEIAFGFRRVYLSDADTVKYLPSLLFVKIRPFWGNRVFNVGPYFSLGATSDGKKVAGGTYSFGLDIGLDIFHINAGMSKVFVGDFYNPYDVLLGKVDAPYELKNYPLHDSRLVPVISGGFKFTYEDGRVKSGLFMRDLPSSYAMFTLDAGSYFNNIRELKITLLDFFAIRNLFNKPFGVAAGFEAATVNFPIGDSVEIRVREPGLSFKAGLDVAGRGGSIILYGLAGTTFDDTKLVYGAGLRLGFITYRKLLGVSFYSVALDFRFLNTLVLNGSSYSRSNVLGLKFGISYHIPIARYFGKKEEEMMKPITPDFLRRLERH